MNAHLILFWYKDIHLVPIKIDGSQKKKQTLLTCYVSKHVNIQISKKNKYPEKKRKF